MTDYISREEKEGITQELLLELFTYEDGKLFWNTTKAGVRKGDRAGGDLYDKTTEYRGIVINSVSFKEHRLIFLFHKGYLPEFIDHKDTIRYNNKIDNLREATRSENAMNRKVGKNNKLGIKGLSFYENRDKPWLARIQHGGEFVLGEYFYTMKEAIKALKETREKFHINFANDG